MYRAYLNSQEVDAIFAGNRQALAGIDILRKICNHPDLLERTKWEGSEEYGRPEKSGKLTVLMKVNHSELLSRFWSRKLSTDTLSTAICTGWKCFLTRCRRSSGHAAGPKCQVFELYTHTHRDICV